MMALSPSQLSSRFEVRSNAIVVGLTSEQLLPGNSNRVTVLFSTATPAVLAYGNKIMPTNADAIVVVDTLEPIILTFRNFGPLIGLPWFVVSDTLATPVNFTEIIYRP